MDIFYFIWNVFASVIYSLPAHIYGFLLRLNLILGLPAIVVFMLFHNGGIRNPKLNILLLATGFLFAMSINLGDLGYTSPVRPWITLLLLINLCALPALWAFLTTKEKLPQKRIRRWIATAVFVLFIANLFLGQS